MCDAFKVTVSALLKKFHLLCLSTEHHVDARRGPKKNGGHPQVRGHLWTLRLQAQTRKTVDATRGLFNALTIYMEIEMVNILGISMAGFC